ncbi:hypothetical protein VOLCADRAFT_116897 [Volvox carteri f. nagariensis]|uniref:Guanylate cyclase domain-containing protein n=1 Tax=Volvox carteri f. nagariensis TaxID=3068 RepID=D8TQB0_VOLCA|nr:uncharacterized protein VOLCADRAFT_116897 [Volvox carteri f. nagariensis]EFJ50372.1 hypothetical protein VOLCADRAFT_116897 [Volvox carteri f. nagariensis]|eukprot:XP_002948497.1 hypothetical protein VOLCADRAFT_116897 [Volvox carteri f. nagariensis]
MASQPAGGQRQHGNHTNGLIRKDREGPGVDKSSRRPTLAADDADAANILQAWDRARAAQDAGLQRCVHTDSGVGPEVSRAAAGSPGVEARSSDASPRDWVQRAKQRRNSYSVPQTKGIPDLLLPGPVASVSQQGTPVLLPSDAPPPQPYRRLPPRRATLDDLKADLSQAISNSGAAASSAAAPQPTTPWASVAILGQHAALPGGSQAPASPKPPSLSGRDGTPTSSSGQHALAATGAGDAGGTVDAGIRRKIIKMISIQRTKQRSMAGNAKPGAQVIQLPEIQGPATVTIGDTDEELEPAAGGSVEAPGSTGQGSAAAVVSAQATSRPVPHDSDDEDVEDVRPSGPPAGVWNMGSNVVGPSTSELRMMGAASSVSFKKNTMKQGVLRPLSTLPPFVPRLFIEDITLNHEKYRGFDAAGRDLTAASKTLQPSIIELQASPPIASSTPSVMIADVTGFTKLTEILSKKGTSGVELLTTCMNNYFTRAINMIMAFEGDVVKFAGDSMIVLFYPNEHERRHADKGLRASTLRMMSCAHQLATKLGHMRMKMNGQAAPPPLAATSALMSAPLPSMLLPGVSNAVPSAEMEGAAEGMASDGPARNYSGPFITVGSRRIVHGDSPRSSATNQALPPTPGGGGTGEEGSSAATDAVSRVLDGPDLALGGSGSASGGGGGAGGNGSLPRKRGKSWNLMANILKMRTALPRRSDAYGGAGSTPSAAASSSGPSRASFEKNEAKAAARLTARERAKTETGLGLALRGGGGLGGSGGAAADGGGASGGAGLWAGGEGVPRASLSTSPLTTMGSGGGAAIAAAAGGASPNATLASGVYPGSGSALANLANSPLTPASGSPRSFTEQAAASGGSFRRAPLGGRSERRIAGGPAGLVVGAGTGDWRSKLQNLSTAIVNAPGGTARSRLSESARAVRWDTVQEEDALAEDAAGVVGSGSGDEDAEEEEEEEEDASYPPIQADSQGGSGSSSPQRAHSLINARGSGQSSGGGAEGAAAAVGGGSGSGGGGSGSAGPLPVAQPSDRVYSPVGSQSSGVAGRSVHAVDLRRKLLLRASQSDRDDMHLRRGGGSQRDDALSTGPGPVAEASTDSTGATSVESMPTSYDGPLLNYADSAAVATSEGSVRPVGPSWSPGPSSGLGPGPVAEASEDVGHGRSRGYSDTDAMSSPHGGAPAESKQASFMSKVVNWFSANARNRGGSYVDSFSHMGPQPGAGGGGGTASGGAGGTGGTGDAQSDAHGSQPPSGPASASNSFNYTTGLAGIARVVPPPNLGPGNGPLGKAPRGDPIMEEVSNSRLSLKVMTSAGSVCVFHVGGGVDEVTDPMLPEVPRWEFFIGDRPLAPLLDANQRRRCISQVAAIEDQARAGSVVASIEVVELIQGEWEVLPLPDNVWRVVGPAQPAPQAQLRLSHTSMRTSATSHTPNWRSSDVGVGTGMLVGSSILPQMAETPIMAAEAPQGGEAMEDLATLQALRMTSSATNGQPGGVPSSVGQPSYGLGAVGHQSLAASLNGSSDRPTNGSAAAAAQLPPRLRHEFVNQAEHVQRRIAGLLRMHVLGSVRFRVEAGHLDFINEIRPLTCMFLGFPSLLQPRDDVAHRDQVQCVQFAYTSVQAVMRKWDGSFLQFRSDEKGFVGICAFGLPGHTHEDNPARGIRAALELASTIRAGGHTVSIGVTTGDLLCTCVGARKLRSEYTVFGDAINLSARLMVKCKKDPSMGEILCDEPTYLRAKYQASFLELERLPVKGKAQPVLVYRVDAHDADAEAQAAQQRREAAEVSSGERPLIGRDAEMTLTLNQAASMISGLSHGGIIIIEGNTGMGKTKLLMEIRKSLERINTDTSISSRPAFHMVFGMADTANKSQKLHPWRRVFQELFALDLKLKNLGTVSVTSTSGTSSQQGQRRTGGSGAGPPNSQGGVACTQGRRRGTEDGPGYAVFTGLGERLSRVPNYDTEWRQHLAELLDLPLASIPLGSLEAEQAQYAQHDRVAGSQGQGHEQAAQSEGAEQNISGSGAGAGGGGGGGGSGSGGSGANGVAAGVPALAMGPEGRELMLPPSVAGGSNNANANPAAGSSMLRSPAPWRAPSMRHASMTMAGTPPVLLDAHTHASTINIGSAAAAAAAAAIGGGGGGGGGASDTPSPQPHGQAQAPHNSQVGAPIRKNSLNFLVHVMQEFISLYGPTLTLLENLHDFDTWSWQLLVKAAELIPADCMILATTRPNDLPAVGSSHHLHGKAALYQKVAMMYRHLLKLPAATRIVLEPFNFAQTRSLMQVVADVSYPDQYVLAVMEKTGGMPLYIEKVTEFLCQSQKPWLPDQGGEFSANVNKMIRNLNFQQVIIERMDRLKPGIHLTLKVASVMGQWVDLDILHKFYPINKSKEELRAHLQELERGNFLKATDAEGVWEFNMVERDIVYEVIPHYQRRRLHAKLAQELEKSLEEQHVATLTTIAYHWNQACMGHEVAEVECSLKAIEFWHRAAEAAYSGSSLMEALKLYQKAAQIAEVLAESMGGSITGTHHHHHLLTKGHGDRHGDGGLSGPGTGGRDGNSLDGRIDATDQSFTAVGSAFRGQLNWSLISRLSRSQWEKSMASCCLGIVLQHRYEFNTQLEYWDTEDYFRLLTEHAIRGLMLLGAPHPNELLNEKGSGASGAAQHGWHSGLVLQDSEVQEIRDILLVLIIAAEHYSLQHDGGEYTRLLTFCKRVCKYFNKCSDSGTDPFLDIRSACSTRIKNYKASRALQTTLDFGVSQEPALEAAAARNAAVGQPLMMQLHVLRMRRARRSAG